MAANANPSPYMTISEVAAYFRLSINTIRAWRRLGKLPQAFKQGKIVRWKREVIEAWEATRQESVESLNIRSLEWSRQALQKRSRS